MEIIKNPVVIGFGSSVLTYFFIEWRKKKKEKENVKNKFEINQLLISFVVGFIVWFIAYGFLELRTTKTPNKLLGGLPSALPEKSMFLKDTLSSSDSPKFPVSIPQKPVPEVLIDMI
jgi:hypothetical protein